MSDMSGGPVGGLWAVNLERPARMVSGRIRDPVERQPVVADARFWTSTAIFTAGTEVSHQDHVYRARWWTRGDDPTAGGYHNPWTDLGPCDD